MSGFLDRGSHSTRLQAFIDAAFAFALTRMVIAGERIPTRVESGWWMGFPGFISIGLNIATPLMEWRQRGIIAAQDRALHDPALHDPA